MEHEEEIGKTARVAQDYFPIEEPHQGISGFLHFAGFRYWTDSLLPALVGTTLPFWLRPPGFSFKWLGAAEFLIATVLVHAGLSFLQAWFEKRSTSEWPASRLLGYSCIFIVSAYLLGLVINSGLQVNKSVNEYIFIIFGISILIVGLLYVVPPVSLCRRIGGEVVIAEGLGMLPVLGAYLVQAGDLTRTVYLASLPLAAATGLWVWIEALISRTDDEKAGRRTLVIDLGPRFSSRFGTPGLALLLITTILAAVFSASIHPLALSALIWSGLAGKIVIGSWMKYRDPERLIPERRNAFWVHLLVCGTLIISSLLTELV